VHCSSQDSCRPAEGQVHSFRARAATDLCLPRPTAQNLGVTQQVDPLVWNLEVGNVVRSPDFWVLHPMHRGSRRVVLFCWCSCMIGQHNKHGPC
jgi:hypothetical protein